MYALPGMFRRFPLLVLALALWFSAEPLVHSHPLWPAGTASTVCAVCATGVDRPIAAPAVAAPLTVIAVVEDAPVVAARTATRLLLSSRAPPAA